MLKLTDNILMNRVGYFDSYRKGKEYYEEGRVRELRTIPNNYYYIGNIYGGSKYEATARFDDSGNIKETTCDCPAFWKYPGDCKHIVALLLALKELDKAGKLKLKQSVGNIENILSHYRQVEDTQKRTVNLEITYGISYKLPYVSLRVGEDKFYVVRNLASFLSAILDKREIEFGKYFTFSPEVHEFSKKDKELIDLLLLLYENYELNKGYGSRWNTTFEDKKVYLSPKSLDKFFDIMMNSKLNIDISNLDFKDVYITDELLELNFNIGEKDSDLTLYIEDKVPIMPMTKDGKYLFYKDRIYKLPDEQAKAIMPIYNEIINKDIKAIRIGENLKEAFISEVLPNIKKYSKINLDKNVENSIYSPPLNASIYFDRVDEKVIGKLIFNYGDIEINPFSSNNSKRDTNKILLREIEKEGEILHLLEQSEFKVENGGFYLEKEELIFDFINEIIPQLQRYCEIFYSQSFKNINLISSERFSGGVRINNDLDMLEFNFDIEGIDVSELDSIFNAIREKKKYYKLKDGSFLSLENNYFDDILDMMDYLNIKDKELKDGHALIPRFRTMYLDKFIKDRELNFIKKNIDFRKMVRDISDPEDMEFEIPEELNASLRDYQKFGFKWLKTLSKYGLGGILADDMGLGKTIQMLTFLLSERQEKGSEANLIIVPTSLVYNWEEEVKKFAPSLKTLLVLGTKDERNNLIKESGDYDLVITSYPLVRRDIEEYKNISFRYCVLDEAQHIKNYNSMNAKSVKLINAKNHFALTGTPMENSLSELWSIFDFLMPGYLLTSSKFAEKFERPIAKEQDNKKLRELNNHIKPFILRRMKKDVLKELPDKIEQKIIVEMTKEQKKLYLAYLQAIKGELSEEISTKGYNKSHIKILAGLTRLRQLCCHPGIFIEDYNGDSGKLEALDEIIEEAINNNRRILIFSQFTTMLEKIKNMLISNNVQYLYLDGSTPTIERGELVRDFNRGVGDVFLISLKAGGTGLNLTSADMVIHYDPWWNPAVEDQATDRAHRIGQKNKVQVIKLITKGTIEEKIFQLQEKKKEMIDKVITEGETLITKLSEEEIMSLFDV